MAAREKKTVGSGPINKKVGSTPSPVPLRESNLQTQSTNDATNEQTEGDAQPQQTDTEQEVKKTENVSKRGANKKDEQECNVEQSIQNGNNDTKKQTPKRGGRKIVGKKNPVIKNKLKTELKAKNKVGKRRANISKKIAKAVSSELAENPDKKAILLKNGIRKTKAKNVNKSEKVIEDNSEQTNVTTTVNKRRKRKPAAKKNVEQNIEVSETKEVEKIDEVENQTEESPLITTKDNSIVTPKKGRRIAKKNLLEPTAAKRLSIKKQLLLKKQKIVDTIAKDTNLDLAAQSVINHLDLVVTANLKNKTASTRKRRHSIEKTAHFNESERLKLNVMSPDFSQLQMTIPRSGSPRSKRGAKMRQSVDLLKPQARTRSPYSTRSDSPARILRNGKHRKLKDLQLLDGIESDRKKRRILSESRDSSEVSKNSGYWSESESSYCESTVSAIENGTPDIQLDVEPLKSEDSVKKLEKIDTIISTQSPIYSDIELKLTQTVPLPKRSLSTETTFNEDFKTEETIDNENNNTNMKTTVKSIQETQIDNVDSNQDTEKSFILNKMAQNFNDNIEDKNNKSTTDEIVVQCNIIKNENDETETKDLKSLTEVSVNKFYGDCENEKTGVVSLLTVDNTAVDDSNIIKNSDNNLDVSNLECNNLIELGNNSSQDIILKIEDDSPIKKESQSIIKQSEDKKCDTIESRILDCINLDSTPMFDDKEKTSAELQAIDEIKHDVDSIVEKLTEMEDELDENDKPVVINDSILKSLDLNTVTDVPVKLQSNISSIGDENKDVSSLENILLNPPATVIIETPENQIIKESILNALGLQSLKAAAEAKVAKNKRLLNKGSDSSYTGTLKTVIKLNRSPEKKKGRGHLKMTFQKSKSKSGNISNGSGTGGGGDNLDGPGSSPDVDNTYYKVMKEVNASWNTGGQSSDTAGANRKSHYSSNRSNTDGSSEHMSDEGGGTGDADDGTSGNSGKAKTLVIPEKASSFSIHPHRLCRDECCYCFGRFGLFDTPCHIAQMKSSERQRKILEIEKHLTPDSCLCDACYRHVDRKANVPAYSKQYKRSNSTGPAQIGQRVCHVIDCQQDASHSVRRKWVLKMKRNLHNYVQFDLESTQGLHSIPVCESHFEALERLMVCAMCKRRLARNHAHNIGYSEAELLNEAFDSRKLPIRLVTVSASTSTENTEDKGGGSVVCKLCRYFASLILKPPDTARPHTLSFFQSYEKRLLHFHDVEMLDEAEAEESIPVPVKEKDKTSMKRSKRSKLSKSIHNNKHSSNLEQQTENSDLSSVSSVNQTETIGSKTETTGIGTEINKELTSTDSVTKDLRVPLSNNQEAPDINENQKSRSNSPSFINGVQNSVENTETNSSVSTNKSEVPQKALLLRRLPKDSKYIVEVRQISKNNKQQVGTNVSLSQKNNKVVERLETNPSISVRQLFPGEDDLPLQGHVEFGTVKERTPEGWEKCAMTVKYDHDTKRLWEELQKPYGNHSSFLRHLVLLEKYFRNGDLVLTPNASHHATNYCESVQNRLRAYDNIPSHIASNIQPIAMLPFNNKQQFLTQTTPIRKQMISQSGIITGPASKPLVPKTSTPLGFQQLSPNFASPINIVRQRPPNVPPGLIQLGGQRPQSTLIRLPPGHRRPIFNQNNNNRVQKPMRPTLIPLTQNKVAATVTSGTLTKQTDITKRPSNLVQLTSGGKSFQLTFQEYSRMCTLKQQQRDGVEIRPNTAKKIPGGVSLSTVSVLRQRSPTNTTTSTTSPLPTVTPSASIIPPKTSTPIDIMSNKSVLEQLKSSVGNFTSDSSNSTMSANNSTPTSADSIIQQSNIDKKSVMILPKIPKSLTVIPQTIIKPTPPTTTESQNPNLSVVSLNKPS